MNILVTVLIMGLFILVLRLNYKIEKEEKRNRILQAFIAGTIRSISNYKSRTDEIDDADDLPAQNSDLPIPYENILESIDWEFSKDFWIEPFKKWLKFDRGLFDDSKYNGDGFNFMYLDFFDKRYKEWFSNELMSTKNKECLRDDIKITQDNFGELEGEIAMLKDLKRGKLDDSSFSPENIDDKLIVMFYHIKPEKREEAKKAILERRTHTK
jgi:hypothetical protein